MMLKSIFLSINILGIFLLSFISIGKVEISHKSNPEIVAGNQTEVSITINKESFSGPGRLKLNFDLAQGLSANELENDGASFTFSNNEALFIWYSIPSEETITIKYILSADASATLGNKKITGTFSYLDENQRKQIAIPDLFIKIVSAPSKLAENSTNISSKRTIEKVEDYFIVRIHTTKQQQKGFARIKDNLPQGFSAQPIEISGAVFKNIDNAAKFLWSEIPSSLESFTVSYKLFPPSGHKVDFEITGTFSAEFLISENENTSIDIPATKFTYKKDELIAQGNVQLNSTNKMDSVKNFVDTTAKSIETPQPNLADVSKNDSASTVNENQLVEAKIKTNETIEENEIDNSIKPEPSLSKNSDKEITAFINQISKSEPDVIQSAIMYRVQILAAHRVAGKNYFYNRHNYSGKFNIENHQGWVKYTTGEFNEYKNARNKRESLKSHKFPGPFVTAYNMGNRITVQEALMISKQDWVQ